MTRSHRLLAIIPAVALVTLLTSCAPAVPEPTSSPQPTAAVAAPTAAPKPAASAIPVVRVPLGCSELMTTVDASNLVSDPQLQLRRDENTVPQDLQQVAVRQRGTLACEWGGESQTDGGYDNNLTVYVAVDAADEYQANAPGLEQQSPPDATNTVGTDSEYECDTASDGYRCTSNMLVGTSWVSAYIQNENGMRVSKAVLDGRVKQMLTGVAEKLTAAGADLPPWNTAIETPPDFCPTAASNAAASTSVVRSAFGDPTLKFTDADQDTGYSDAQLVSGPSDEISTCVWESSASEVALSTLAGASWVFPELAATPPFVNMIGKLTPVTLAGADAAVMGSGAGSTEAWIAIGPDAYDVSFDDAGQAKDIAELTALIAQLKDN